MEENSGAVSGASRSFVSILFLGGWIVTVAVLVLFMRAWIPDVDLMTELAELERADTAIAEPDGPASTPLQPLPGNLPPIAVTGTEYLPIYESLYVGGQRALENLSATVSLRNASGEQPIIVTAVTYFNKSGEAVANRVDAPHTLAPMAAAEFYLDQSLGDGGPVASIAVQWAAERSVEPPIVEAVIVGSYGVKSISFVTRSESRP